MLVIEEVMAVVEEVVVETKDVAKVATTMVVVVFGSGFGGFCNNCKSLNYML